MAINPMRWLKNANILAHHKISEYEATLLNECMIAPINIDRMQMIKLCVILEKMGLT